MEQKKQTPLMGISILYNVFTILMVVTSIIIGIVLVGGARGMYYTTLSTLFNRIPVVGNMLYGFLGAKQYFNADIFLNNLFRPLLLLDALLLCLPLIIFQGVAASLKRYVMKHDSAIFSAVILMGLLFGMWITLPNSLFITANFSTGFVQTKTTVLRVLVGCQALILLAILFFKHKEGTFVLKSVMNHDRARLYAKRGLVTSLIMFIVIGGTLFAVQTAANEVKNQLHFDYVINIIPDDHGRVLLNVPNKIKEPLTYAGISVPDAIDEGLILNQLGINHIDVGGLAASYSDSFIDNTVFEYIHVPQFNALLAIGLATLALILEFIAQKRKEWGVALYIVELGIIGWLTFSLSPTFSVVVVVAAGVVFIGSLLHVLTIMRDRHWFEILKSVRITYDKSIREKEKRLS